MFLVIEVIFQLSHSKQSPFFLLLDTLPSFHRYQPGTLNSSSQTEKLVELVEGEKVAVSGGDSGDEYGMEMEETPLRETFTAKLLFCPSGKIPTQTSGNIVYATTAIICKYVMEEAKDRTRC